MSTTAEKIAVMQAHIDGKAIECSRQDGNKSQWSTIATAPSWNWDWWEFRIKPEPRRVWIAYEKTGEIYDLYNCPPQIALNGRTITEFIEAPKEGN